MQLAAMDLLYPIRLVKYPAENTARVVPRNRKKNRLPARAWLIANSSSIIGRKGDMIARAEKLRNQRHQKMKRINRFTS
jgi:hypothetical protein